MTASQNKFKGTCKGCQFGKHEQFCLNIKNATDCGDGTFQLSTKFQSKTCENHKFIRNANPAVILPERFETGKVPAGWGLIPTTVKKKGPAKTSANIMSDILNLPGKDLIEKCTDDHCKYYRATGCLDNCARGEYGNPDCHYVFETEEERKLHNPDKKEEVKAGTPAGKRKYTRKSKPEGAESQERKCGICGKEFGEHDLMCTHCHPNARDLYKKAMIESNQMMAEMRKIYLEYVALEKDKNPVGIKAIDLLEVFHSAKNSNAFETLADLCKEKGIEIIIRPVTK